jgi:hypothetical protein
MVAGCRKLLSQSRGYVGHLGSADVARPDTVPVRAAIGFAQRPPNTKTSDARLFSTRNNSTTMAPIDDAVAAIESLEDGEHFTYQAIANQSGVNRVMLSQRHRGHQRPREAKEADQQCLSPQEEHELVLYIKALSKRGLPPTREMIQKKSSDVIKRRVSEAWVTRFLHRNHDKLTSKWSSGIDTLCHKASSEAKYKLYFDLLHSRIKEYKMLTSDTYNMDEKGFMIGIMGRSKRVFSGVNETKGR